MSHIMHCDMPFIIVRNHLSVRVDFVQPCEGNQKMLTITTTSSFVLARWRRSLKLRVPELSATRSLLSEGVLPLAPTTTLELLFSY